MEQKNKERYLVFKITAFEPGSTNSHSPKQDTCHWQSVCYEVTLRFKISLRGIFQTRASQSDEKYNESARMKILPEFWTF